MNKKIQLDPCDFIDIAVSLYDKAKNKDDFARILEERIEHGLFETEISCGYYNVELGSNKSGVNEAATAKEQLASVKKCRKCGGAGKWIVSVGVSHASTEYCSTCHGNGFVSDDVIILNNGDKIYPNIGGAQ